MLSVRNGKKQEQDGKGYGTGSEQVLVTAAFPSRRRGHPCPFPPHLLETRSAVCSRISGSRGFKGQTFFFHGDSRGRQGYYQAMLLSF